jgi:hypothetical protein
VKEWQTVNGIARPVEVPDSPPPAASGESPPPTTCAECGDPLVRHTEETETCMGYFSPPGHDHDDNRLSRTYRCGAGHPTMVTLIRSCPACEWRGRTEGRVDEWPALASSE